MAVASFTARSVRRASPNLTSPKVVCAHTSGDITAFHSNISCSSRFASHSFLDSITSSLENCAYLSGRPQGSPPRSTPPPPLLRSAASHAPFVLIVRAGAVWSGVGTLAVALGDAMSWGESRVGRGCLHRPGLGSVLPPRAMQASPIGIKLRTERKTTKGSMCHHEEKLCKNRDGGAMNSVTQVTESVRQILEEEANVLAIK